MRALFAIQRNINDISIYLESIKDPNKKLSLDLNKKHTTEAKIVNAKKSAFNAFVDKLQGKKDSPQIIAHWLNDVLIKTDKNTAKIYEKILKQEPKDLQEILHNLSLLKSKIEEFEKFVKDENQKKIVENIKKNIKNIDDNKSVIMKNSEFLNEFSIKADAEKFNFTPVEDKKAESIAKNLLCFQSSKVSANESDDKIVLKGKDDQIAEVPYNAYRDAKRIPLIFLNNSLLYNSQQSDNFSFFNFYKELCLSFNEKVSDARLAPRALMLANQSMFSEIIEDPNKKKYNYPLCLKEDDLDAYIQLGEVEKASEYGIMISTQNKNGNCNLIYLMTVDPTQKLFKITIRAKFDYVNYTNPESQFPLHCFMVKREVSVPYERLKNEIISPDMLENVIVVDTETKLIPKEVANSIFMYF